MRTKIVAISVLLMGVLCGYEIYHQTGAVHATKKNGFGCLCHGFSPDTSVRVWISGPESLGTSQQAIYRINVTRGGGIGAGFNVAALRGALGIADTAGTFLERESSTDSLELTHTVARLRTTGDTISWNFYYRAPSITNFTDTMYAVGNVVNNDTLPDGDFWNYGPNFRVRVHPLTGVARNEHPRTHRLLQNYPNPFNPSTRIKYELVADSHVRLAIYDITGKMVATIVDAPQNVGTHEVVFEAASLAGGLYLYQLAVTSGTKAGEFISVRKMLMVK